VGHFHEAHEVPKRVEIQHRRYSNIRRVGKKKLLNPRSRQTPTKAKRYTQPTQLRAPHNPTGNEERQLESKIHKQKGRRLRHRGTYPGTADQRQVRKTQPKPPRTTYIMALYVLYISTNHLHNKHILSMPRLAERRLHCEHRRRARSNSLITNHPVG
jgi:hypothetical protein